MVSIRCAPRHSISNADDFKNLFPKTHVSFVSSSATGSLQFLNVRVATRLHRYRLFKRRWEELTTTVQNYSSSSPSFESSLPTSDIISSPPEQKTNQRKAKTKEYPFKLGPLHSRIQQDLFQLRGLIRERQEKLTKTLSLRTNTNNRPCRERKYRKHRGLTEPLIARGKGDIREFQKQGGITPQENIEKTCISSATDNRYTTTIRKSSSLNRAKPLDCMQISGCRISSALFPQSNSTDSGISTISNSSSICSQYSQRPRKIKEQTNNKTHNIYRSCAINSLTPDCFILGVPPPKNTSNTQVKTIQNTCLKQVQSFSLPVQPVIKKKQSSIIKSETPSSPVHSPSDTEESTTCHYTYAASTSSAMPHSMKLNRNTSSLPILLTSSSCLGIQPHETHLKNRKENKTNYHNMLDYQNLINHLSKPIIPIHSRYDQDGYGILFAQLDHIRETMPNSNVYNNYTRIL